MEYPNPLPLTVIRSSLVTFGGLYGDRLIHPLITAALVILKVMARQRLSTEP